MIEVSGLTKRFGHVIAVDHISFKVEEGEVFEIFDNPIHPYTRMLLESLPQGSKHDKRLCTIPGTLPDPTLDISGCPFQDRCPSNYEKCSRKTPPLTIIRNGHKTACHLATKEV